MKSARIEEIREGRIDRRGLRGVVADLLAALDEAVAERDAARAREERLRAEVERLRGLLRRAVAVAHDPTGVRDAANAVCREILEVLAVKP